MCAVCPQTSSQIPPDRLERTANVMSAFIQAFLLSAIIYVAWKLCQLVFARTALDNIRGPPSRSLWKGAVLSVLYLILLLTSTSLGNFRDVFNPNAWKFQQEIAETCRPCFYAPMNFTALTFFFLTDGGVVKFKGLFGVRSEFYCEIIPRH